jgi:hypothetical protein
MIDPVTGTPDPTLTMQFLHRCTETFYRLKQNPPAGATADQLWEHHQQACAAFRAQLPILLGPENFQIFVACINQGWVLGAIDTVDLGKYNNLVNTAIAAWRSGQQQLRQMRIEERDQQRTQDREEARNQPRRRREEEERTDPPTPTKGNHNDDYESVDARAQLPGRKTLNQLMKELRRHGVAVPSEKSLRKNPLVALNLVDLALNHRDTLPPADDAVRLAKAEQPPERPANAA